jgi:hypothetical protein
MLAEIFLLKLENMVRAGTTKPETASDPRFVPIALPRR